MTDEKDVIKDIGSMLKRRMKEENISMYKIEKEIDLPFNTIKKVLEGSGGYNIKSLILILKTLSSEIKIEKTEDEKAS